MHALADLQFFVRAGRASSLSEAARAVGLTPAAGSAAIKRLEAELGVRLLARSTRALRLTQEGEHFLAHCEQALAILTQAREELSAGQGELRGCVQLSMPSDLGRNWVLGWLQDFRREHPGVELRLQVSDRLAELHREPVDVVLRYGEPPDSTLVALSVAPHNRRVLCASPAYLARHGRPQHPQDLRAHACISFLLGERVHDRWRFERGDERCTVHIDGPVRCDDGDVVRRLALLGEGVVYKSRLDVAEDLRAGTLQPLCEDWLGEPAPLYLACSHRSALRPVVRRLRDALVAQVELHLRDDAGRPVATPGLR